MPSFICVNEKCGFVELTILVPQVKLVFDNKTNTLEPSEPILCKGCNNTMIQVRNKTLPILVFNEFDSLSPQQKRERIHKRSVKYFEKTDKGELQRHKQQIIDDNKRAVIQGGQK